MSQDDFRLGDPMMLERIDKLIACGTGTLIDLPQIIVIGDQSSGKSSVLAGLIRKGLPRDSGLCTRFATHIIFRRSDPNTICALAIVSSRCVLGVVGVTEDGASCVADCTASSLSFSFVLTTSSTGWVFPAVT